MRLIPSLAVAALLAAAALPARADVIFSVSGVSTSGGTLSGTFTTNDALSTVTSFSITTPVSQSFLAFTYNASDAAVTASSLPSQYLRLDTAGDADELQLFFAGGLTSAGGTLLATSSYEHQPSGGNRLLSGTVASVPATPVAVPEPMSLGLLGLGVAGLAAVRRRRRAA